MQVSGFSWTQREPSLAGMSLLHASLLGCSQPDLTVTLPPGPREGALKPQWGLGSPDTLCFLPPGYRAVAYNTQATQGYPGRNLWAGDMGLRTLCPSFAF